DPGIAEEADLAYYPMDGCGVWYLAVTCSPRKLGKVRKILDKTLGDLPRSITPEQLQRAKHKLATALTLDSESPRGRMSGMGEHWLYTGEYLPLEEEIAQIMAVSMEDLHA